MKLNSCKQVRDEAIVALAWASGASLRTLHVENCARLSDAALLQVAIACTNLQVTFLFLSPSLSFSGSLRSLFRCFFVGLVCLFVVVAVVVVVVVVVVVAVVLLVIVATPVRDVTACVCACVSRLCTRHTLCWHLHFNSHLHLRLHLPICAAGH